MPNEVTTKPTADTTELVPISRTIDSWVGAATRGLEARRERELIISKVLIAGADFGVIPGTQKPTLLKPGAEKIIDSLNLWPDYVCESRVEDWEKPLFFYRYRCILRARGSDTAIASGLGSCNSMEDRYRWRKASRLCPRCHAEAIIVGKEEYGGGFLCFKKKGGCGAKYNAKDPLITSQPEGRALNEDIYSQVNTIDKMAQKRALVAATLDLGFSEHFTQDMEDLAPAEEPSEPRMVETLEEGKKSGRPPIKLVESPFSAEGPQLAIDASAAQPSPPDEPLPPPPADQADTILPATKQAIFKAVPQVNKKHGAGMAQRVILELHPNGCDPASLTEAQGQALLAALNKGLE